MEHDESTGRFQSRDGKWHNTQWEAEQSNRGPVDAAGGFMGGAAGLFANAGAALIIFLIGMTFLVASVRQYWLFILFWLPAYILIKGFWIHWKRFLIAVGIGIVGTLFAHFIFYPHVIEPSPFTHDYIISEVDLHSRRFASGKASARVSVGERVTVNGLSRDRLAFNITTKDGIKGWIPAEAFPQDANMPRDYVRNIVKATLPFSGKQPRLQRDNLRNNKIAMRDRDWITVRPVASLNYWGLRYDEEGSRVGVSESGLTQRALNAARPVNLTVKGQWAEKFREIQEVDVTLQRVMYMPETTIIQITADERAVYDLLVGKPHYAWQKSTVIRDLDTGETFPLWAVEAWVSHDDNPSYIVLFFPPTKSRHFALVHEEPLNWGNRNRKNALIWDFPEVIVR